MTKELTVRQLVDLLVSYGQITENSLNPTSTGLIRLINENKSLAIPALGVFSILPVAFEHRGVLVFGTETGPTFPVNRHAKKIVEKTGYEVGTFELTSLPSEVPGVNFDRIELSLWPNRKVWSEREGQSKYLGECFAMYIPAAVNLLAGGQGINDRFFVWTGVN